jgi:hypothetical protein
MDSGGYTLAEALTALVMVGLAMTGAGEAVHFLSSTSLRLHSQSAAASERAFVQHALAGLPPDLGPFRSDAGGFAGSPLAVSFPCDIRDQCSITLAKGDGAATMSVAIGDHRRAKRLRYLPELHFGFISAADGSAWPSWPDGRSGDRLGGLLVTSGPTPVAYLRLSKVQPDACAFDPATGACRKIGG